MKKWMLHEEEMIVNNRELFEAYNKELKKNGILDAEEVVEGMPIPKTLKEMTKAELIDDAKYLGIKLDMKQSKAEMIAAIESYSKPVEEAIEGEVVILDEPITEENVYVEEA